MLATPGHGWGSTRQSAKRGGVGVPNRLPFDRQALLLTSFPSISGMNKHNQAGITGVEFHQFLYNLHLNRSAGTEGTRNRQVAVPGLRHCQNLNFAIFERKLAVLLPKWAFNQSLKLGFLLLNETLKYLTYINLTQLSEGWCGPSLYGQVTKHCINPCLGKEIFYGIASASG